MTTPGDRLTDKLTRALVDAQRLMQADDHDDAVARSHDKIVHHAEAWEAEAAEVLREHLGKWLDDPDVDGELRDQLQKLTEPTHFAALAAVIPALIALAYMLGQAAMEGPASKLRTLSLRNFGDVPWPADPFIQAAVNRRLTNGPAEKMVEDAGMDKSRVDSLVESMRGYPPLGAMVTLAQRGFVDKAEITNAMMMTGMVEAYAHKMAELVTEPAPWTQALNAELQGVLDAGRVKQIMKLNGLDPADHDWLYEANGMPPPIEELIQLWRRDIATAGDVHQALLEGPVKNKWIPLIMQMRDRIPPQETVIALTRRGVFTPAEGIDLLHKGGFPLDLATKMIRFAENLDDNDTREATKAEITNAYQLGLVDRSAALSMLQQIRYTAEHAEQVMRLVDAQRERRMLDAALTRLRTAYVTWRMTEADVQTAMDALEVAHDMRSELLHVWGIERGIATRDLTPAQVVKAIKQQLLTPEQGLSRLRGSGYSEDDAKLLIEMGT